MTNENPLMDLRPHFVAFLDILGFSEMVESDARTEKQNFLSKLFRCHQSAAVIFRDNANCSITQFSDSIVVAMPYDATRFQWFASRVAEYQRLLLDERLLCRGGIAVNKHFSNGTFTFSAGLIQAYRVESKAARYPRVVISPEVLSLVYPDMQEIPPFLIKEDDGLFFIDYLGLTARKRSRTLSESIADIVHRLSESDSSSVREKGQWIAAYSDAILGTTHSQPRFSGRRVRRIEAP
ncbi:hypothetical protein [Burkholderia multivorans]|uniref:hypothetical protein n=1 Tax=Burkholderia multivorans TaxID=87883 RepID=UPI0012DA5508|nr:hypothetical protein [Burkholderia multivorans]